MSARADMLSKVEAMIKIELSFPVCLSAFILFYFFKVFLPACCVLVVNMRFPVNLNVMFREVLNIKLTGNPPPGGIAMVNSC